MASQLGAFHPTPLPLGACGAYTTAVSAGPPSNWWVGRGGRSQTGAAPRCRTIHTLPFSLSKILQHQAALLAAAQGPGLGQVAAVAAQMQHVAAFSLVATPLLPAAGTENRGRGPCGEGQRGGVGLTRRPPLPPAANNSPGSGPGTLPGLPAPIGVNGFSPLTPQTNGQPVSDTLYNNGLSAYPGGPPNSTKTSRKWSGEEGGVDSLGRAFSPSLLLFTQPCPPACLHCGLAHLSPQPRAPAWLTPCSRPTLGCTTTQVSLGSPQPGWRGRFEGSQKVVGKCGACSLLRSLPSQPRPLNDLSKGESYCGLG